MMTFFVKKYIKAAASVVFSLFIAITLFSCAYIALESGHECTENDCPICACIQLSVNSLRQIGSGTPAIAVIHSCFILLLAILAVPQSCTISQTLIRQKIRLND